MTSRHVQGEDGSAGHVVFSRNVSVLRPDEHSYRLAHVNKCQSASSMADDTLGQAESRNTNVPTSSNLITSNFTIVT